jgi:hypothetical protein
MTDGFARAAQGLATIRPPRLVRSAFGLLAAFLGRPAFFADFALLALREPLVARRFSCQRARVLRLDAHADFSFGRVRGRHMDLGSGQTR